MGAMKYCVILVLLYAIPVTATTTVFHTNCTRPPSASSFNFVTAPNTRGTLEILWSCLFTLLICTWQVQHLNVPPQDSSSVARFWAKPYWMLMTLFAPEYLLAMALEEFFAAKMSVEYMERELPELVQQGGWTMTHAFYANMYGFMVRRAVAEPESATSPMSKDTSMFQPFVIPQSNLLVLNTERMVTYLNSLPPPKIFIRDADIRRRAKRDIFPKCIAGLQVFWFIVQVLARKARNLPVSQLEISVLAFAICTLASYLLWMKKPQDVSVPTFLDEGPEPLPVSVIDSRSEYVLGAYDIMDNRSAGGPLSAGEKGFFVGGTIFGAIHLLAWNLHFPTHIEKTLWRTSSIATTVIMPLLFLVAILDVYKPQIYDVIMKISVTVYAVCRLFIVVEIFRSLGYLSAGAFATTWSTYVPHVM